MTEEEMKTWIDNASLEDLLRKWRFAPTGDPLLRNDTGMGKYFEEEMARKRDKAGPEEYTRISKAIGWDHA